MSNPPPDPVGAPSELAQAEEMPGWVVGAVKTLYAIPYFFLWELPTLPLDGFVLLQERFGNMVAGVYLLGLIGLVGALCWGLVNWVGLA
jgi:hypothetical protein